VKSSRLAVGVLPALVCASALWSAVGCSDSPRKDPAPGEAGRGPTAAAATPTPGGNERKQPANEGTSASKAADPVAPTVKPDPVRDVSIPTEFEHPPEDETTHRHAPAPPKGTLEGVDAQGQSRWACREERAFRPKGTTVFADAAPGPLTDALNEVAKKAAPMSLVLQRKEGQLFAALSATRDNGANKEAFLPGKNAPFAPLVLAFGGDPVVTTDEPLPRGYVQLFDKKGPVVLELRRLLWKATRGTSCDDVEVDVHATIPFAQYGLTLHLAKGDKTIAELAGVPLPPDGADDGAPPGGDASRQPRRLSVHFTFSAVAAPFDGGAR